MSRELYYYLRFQAVISASFNFFINGMIAALIYHNADFVVTDAISVTIDITVTCLLIFTITAPFCRASLRRDKTGGLLAAENLPARMLAGLSRYPVLLSVSLSLCTALILSTLAVSFLALLGVSAVPFYLYIALKSVLSAMIGAFATYVLLIAGMYKSK